MNILGSEICIECGFEGEPDKVFSMRGKGTDLEKESIILICPQCGRSTIRGQRINGEEFYY